MFKEPLIVCSVSIVYLAACSQLYAQENASVSSESLDPLAIVISPIEVLSVEPGMDELAEAVEEEFYSELGGIDGLNIVQPGLVQPYAGSSIGPEEIAEELGAATVLETSVLARPNGYEVRYAIIDVRTGKHHSNGMHYGKGKWGPDFSFDSRIRDFFPRVSEHVEQQLFPDRSTATYETILAESKANLLNTSLSDRDRLAALRALAPGRSSTLQGYSDGGESLTGDVAVAAIQLATQSADPFVRGSVWHTMRWVPDPNLIDPLLHALVHDTDAKVRMAAAMALEIHSDAANVKAALQAAADTDSDSYVRSEAAFSAADHDGQWELLSNTVMNDTVREWDRRYALIKLRSLDPSTQLPIDSPLVTASLRWIETTENSDLRTTIWWSLHKLVGAPIARPAIDALFNDPSENTRESLASLLSEYLDEPGVRDALNKAKATDDSPLVKAAASCSLQGGGWC